jgi:hypothetical protein
MFLPNVGVLVGKKLRGVGETNLQLFDNWRILKCTVTKVSLTFFAAAGREKGYKPWGAGGAAGC